MISGPIFVLEWAAISKYVDVSFGATYQKIAFDTVRLFSIDIPYDANSSRFMMYVKLGLGFGA